MGLGDGGPGDSDGRRRDGGDGALSGASARSALASAYLPALLPTLLATTAVLLLDLPHGAWNLDEEGYRLAASQLAQGRLCLPFPEDLPRAAWSALRHVHGVIVDGAVCAKYPPGAPGLYALGFALGWARLGPALATGLAVFALGSLGRQLDAEAGARAAWLAALSPFLLLNGGLFLAEGPALAFTALAFSTASSGRAGWAGLALGALGLTKPALAAVALPPALWLVGRRGWAKLLLGGLPALGLLMAHNHALTGAPLTLAFSSYAPTDHPGFGPHVGGHPLEFPTQDGHSLSEGLTHLGMNALLFLLWVGGHGGAVLLAGLEAVRRRRQPLVRALLGLSAGLLALHLAYWYPGVPHAGPVYFLPLLALVMPLAGAARGRFVAGVLVSGVLLSWGVTASAWQRELGPAVAAREALLAREGLVELPGEGLLPVSNLGWSGTTVFSFQSPEMQAWWASRKSKGLE